MEIKKLTHQDIDQFIALIRVFEEVFEMENFVIPSQEHLQKVLLKPDFIVFVAIMDEQVIGGLTTYVLEQYYAEKPLAYIFDLAVQTRYQRQGIGKQLIVSVTNYCREKGFEEVFVQADKVDEYALDFYRSTDVTAEEEVVHFYYTINS